MSNAKLLALVCVGVLGTLVPRAKADEWNQKTTITFNSPVEIPGQVLGPGTYVFKLADSQSDRNIVQVFNKDETHLYGTFLAVPDYHLRPAGKPIITFEERAEGAPQAVRAWFYPGDYYGHQFVYPKQRAQELAKLNNQTVASLPNDLAETTGQQAETLRQAPLTAQEPSQQEEQLSQAFPPQQEQALPPQQQNENAQANREEQPATQQPPQTLPQTGSSLPLIGLLGLMSLGTAGALSLVAVKVRK